MNVLITGAAGFIGSHVVEAVLAAGHEVIAVDNFEPMYPRELKERNFREACGDKTVHLLEIDLSSGEAPQMLADGLEWPVDAIIHLAARAGVRRSIQDPVGYLEGNVMGTQQLLEFARAQGIRQFVFASSSSVYGTNPRVPWQESDKVLEPISPYASSKVSCELMGHVYAHLHDIRFLALRFFTVYGPRQRPDLAIHRFARLILDGKPIPVYGDGSTKRDYTYVGDTVGAVLAALTFEGRQYGIYNIGNDVTVSLAEMIATLETVLGKKAIIERLPEQAGDVPQTWADIGLARRELGYAPRTAFESGVRRFMDWLTSV